MPTLTLDDDELRALCDLLTRALSDLLTDAKPNPFPLSPKRSVWLSALEKLTQAMEDESRPRTRQVKDPT
jgi:hypothetical protein